MGDAVYEVSSVHLVGFLKTARAMGVLDAALPRLSAKARAVVEHPHDARWFPASVIQELTEQVAATSSGEVLAELNYRMTKDALGRLILPLLKVALAIAGKSPSTIFTRLDQLASVAMKGLRVSWTAKGAQAGTLRFEYPVPPPTVAHHSWGGAFRFGFELAGAQGVVDSHAYDGNTLLMNVSWK